MEYAGDYDNNGRVALGSAQPAVPFDLDSRAPGDARGYSGAGLQRYGGTDLDEAGALFFSAENVDALQEAIRYRVFVGSSGRFTIGRQSDRELAIVMRSIYLQDTSGRSAQPAQAQRRVAYHERRGRAAALEEVRALNRQVLDFCVPRVLEEVRMNAQYLRDVSTLPQPLDRGEFSSSKGTRVLETTSFM